MSIIHLSNVMSWPFTLPFNGSDGVIFPFLHVIFKIIILKVDWWSQFCGHHCWNVTTLSRTWMMMKSLQIFWKCYEYGDNLVNVFEFIDDQRSKSVRDITIPDPEITEEFIDKHGSIVRSTFSLLEKIQQELFMLRCTRDPIQNFASPLSPMPLGHSIHTQNRAILTAPQLQLRATSFNKKCDHVYGKQCPVKMYECCNAM